MAFINGTLILQAAHFVIAFYLIKYLLFKPVFVHIEREDTLQESLVSAVQEHQAAVAQKEHEISDQWQALRSHFMSHAPSLKEQHLVIPKSSIMMPEFSAQQLQAMAREISGKIVSQVNHVS